MGSRPDDRNYNLYFWYYGTLSLFQHGGESWTDWNEALRDRIVVRQSKRGHASGSWDPNSYWAAYGGRIYSTTMATLCLEAYYRYIPLYLQTRPLPNDSREVSRSGVQASP